MLKRIMAGQLEAGQCRHATSTSMTANVVVEQVFERFPPEAGGDEICSKIPSD